MRTTRGLLIGVVLAVFPRSVSEETTGKPSEELLGDPASKIHGRCSGGNETLVHPPTEPNGGPKQTPVRSNLSWTNFFLGASYMICCLTTKLFS